MKATAYYMWDWQCGQCSVSGSAPIDIGTPAITAVFQVALHHKQISRNCHDKYLDRHIEIIGITKYR